MKDGTKRRGRGGTHRLKKKAQNYRQLFSRQTFWEMLTYCALMLGEVWTGAELGIQMGLAGKVLGARLRTARMNGSRHCPHHACEKHHLSIPSKQGVVSKLTHMCIKQQELGAPSGEHQDSTYLFVKFSCTVTLKGMSKIWPSCTSSLWQGYNWQQSPWDCPLWLNPAAPDGLRITSTNWKQGGSLQKAPPALMGIHPGTAVTQAELQTFPLLPGPSLHVRNKEGDGTSCNVRLFCKLSVLQNYTANSGQGFPS